MDRARSRSRRRWTAGGVVFVVVAWAGVSAVLLGGAANDARTAKVDLEAARARFSPDELIEGEGLVALGEAQAHFAAAERRSGSPLLAPARVLPVLGRQVHSLNALAAAGADVLRVAVDAAGEVDELRRGEREPDARVAAVEQLHATVTRAAQELRAVSLGPDEALLAPLADARQTVAEELEEALASLETAEVVTAALVDVLDGSRFLVLASNNAEMQAGWGMPLSVGVLEVVDGDLVLQEMEATGGLLLPAGAVPLSGDLADNWAFMRPSQDFRNLALTASFEQAAPVAAAMWEELGRGPVEGVLVLDPLALRSILASTGPVEVAGGAVTVDDVVPFTLHDAYVVQDLDPSGLEARRERQSEIAVAAVRAATAPGTDLVELARNLADAAANRHVMVWSADPGQQAAWVAAGVDGGLDADSLVVGLVNRAVNKLDWFLDVAASVSVEPGADGTEVAITMELVNRTPDGEPYYVAGPGSDYTGPPISEGDWRGFLTVHLPGSATDASIDGLGLSVDGRSVATRVISGVVLVPKGETRTQVVRFTLPPGSETVTVEPSARVRPIRWDTPGDSWSDDTGARVVELAP